MKALNQKPVNARQAAEILKAAKVEYQQIQREAPAGGSYMADLARQARADFENFTAVWREPIINDTLASWETTLTRFSKAKHETDVVKANTGAQWDAKRMGHERAFAEGDIKIQLAGVSDFDGGAAGAVQSALSKALLIEDGHRRKAQLEAILTVEIADRNARREVSLTQNQARQHLQAMEITPEIAEAQQRQTAAGESVRAAYAELQNTALALGENVGGVFDVSGQLAQAARRVQFGMDGSIEVFAPDNSEVTGVHWR